ncbi:MAG TPA: SGNH/GDSL hydrolase family protein [Verrucomicrobiae bacterium]|nr:SGNH/GDSL hydrolase family protein [Verrucomicrobiae bacterium]
MRQIALLTFAFFAPIAFSWAQTNRFEAEIRAFEASDRTNPPPKRGVVFVGSSSIRLWTTLAQDFPKQHVINRGFGGSEISDSIHYAKRIVIPYRPRLVVIYAGGNDIHAGKTPDTVFADFTNFVATLRATLPRTRIAYISIAPNPARWAEVDKVRAANRLIADYVHGHRNMEFIDVFPHMLGSDGQPRPEIYREDRLHMNEKGYALWKDIVKRYL